MQHKWDMSDLFTSIDLFSFGEFVACVEKDTDLWMRDEKGNTLLHRAVVASVDALYKTNLLLERCPALLHARNELLEMPLQTLLSQIVSQKEAGKPTTMVFQGTLALLLACGANIEAMNVKGVRSVTWLRQLGLMPGEQLPTIVPLDLAQKQLLLRKGIQSLLTEQDNVDPLVLLSHQLRQCIEPLSAVDRLPLTTLGALLGPREWLWHKAEKGALTKTKAKTPSKLPKAVHTLEAQITGGISHFSQALHIPPIQRIQILNVLHVLREYFIQPLPEGADFDESALRKHRFFLSGFGLDLQPLSYGASLFFENYFESSTRLLPSGVPISAIKPKMTFQNSTINDVYYRLKTGGWEADEAVRQLSQAIFSGQGFAVTGFLFLHKLWQDEKTIKRDYLPLFVSKPPVGHSFSETLRAKGNAGLNQRFTTYHYSLHFILSCLTQPGEGLPDYYRVSDAQGLEKRSELIGIESMNCFSPLAQSNDDLTVHQVGIKTVIFCLSQMDEPMDLVARREFLAQDPSIIVLQWLKGLCAFRAAFSAECISLWGLTEGYFKLELLTSSKVVLSLYKAIGRLQAIVKANPAMTHHAILTAFEPLLGAYYEKIRALAKGDWESAKRMLEQGESLEHWSQQQSAIRPLWENVNQKTVVVTDTSTTSYPIDAVCEALIAKVDSASLDEVTQRRLLEEAVTHFPHLQHLSLRGCKVLDEPLCLFLSDHLKNLVSLSLDRCVGISANALQRLLVRFPALELKLANVPSLSPADILSLEQHSQNLSVVFDGKTYDLKSTKLSPSVQQTIRQACFREAISEGNLDWALFFLQSGVHLGEGAFSPLHEAIIHYQLNLVKQMLLWGLDANGIWKRSMPLDTAYTTYEVTPVGSKKDAAGQILVALLKGGAVQCDKKYSQDILSTGLKLQMAQPDAALRGRLWQFGLSRGCLTSAHLTALLPSQKGETLFLAWQRETRFGEYQLMSWINDFFAEVAQRQLKLHTLNISGCQGFDKAMLATCFRYGLEKLTLDVTQANALDLLEKPLPQLEITLSSIELDPKNKATDFPALLRVLVRPGCRLEILRVYGVEFTVQELSDLCRALNGYRHLRVLHFREVRCETHFRLLLASLRNSPLEEVILERVVQPQGNWEQQSLSYCQDLATFLQEQPRLRKLSVDRNHWGDMGLRVLFGVLGKHPRLREIYLNEVEMTDIGLESLRTALMLNHHVSKLDLRFNRLSESSMLRLIGLVQFNVTIQEVLYGEQYRLAGQDTVKLANDPKIVSALRRNRIHHLLEQRLPISEPAMDGNVDASGSLPSLFRKKPGGLMQHRPRRSAIVWSVEKNVQSRQRQQMLLDQVEFIEIMKVLSVYKAALAKREAHLLREERWEQNDRVFWEETHTGLNNLTLGDDRHQRLKIVTESVQKSYVLFVKHAEERMDLLERLRLKQATLAAFETLPTFQKGYVDAMLNRGWNKIPFNFTDLTTFEVLLSTALACQTEMFLDRLLAFLQRTKDTKLVKQLLLVSDQSGQNLLMWAAQQGNAEQVSWLVDQGIPIDQADQANRTAFLFAALGGNLTILAYLIDRGANIHQEDDRGRNAILYAAQGGHLTVMEWLLQTSDRFSINAKSMLLETPLLRAAAGGQVEALDTLLTRQAGSLFDVDKAGQDLLLIAAQADQPAVVEWALTRGLSLDKPNVFGKTARELLQSKEGFPTLRAWWSLREALHTQASDAKVHAALTRCLAIEGKAGSRLHSLAWISLVTHGRLEVLLAIDASVPASTWFATDNQSNTLLHVAAQHHQAKVAEWLLKKGLSGKEKNALGQTAYQVAMEKGAIQVSGVLLGIKAPVLSESAFVLHKTPEGEKKLLGIGAFSQVYGGHWQHTEIAYKQLTMAVSFDSSAFFEFTSEVNLLAKSQHPHIVRLYGVTLSPLGLVMEWVSQGLLRYVLDETTSGKRLPLTFGQRVTIGEDVAKGLAFLHSPGIQLCHRDLKSDNVLLDEQLRAKLTDFGLAQVKSLAGPSVVAGSVPWLAPEALQKHPVQTATSDIYSYGVTLWELMTQQVPYQEASVDFICQQVLAQKTLPLPESFPTVWVSLLQNCWQFNPNQRLCAEEVVQYFQDHRAELEGGASRGNPAVLHFKGEDEKKRDQRQTSTPYTYQSVRYLLPMLENRSRLLLYVIGPKQNLERVFNYLAILSVTFGKPAGFLFMTAEKEGVFGGLFFGQRLIWIDVHGQMPPTDYHLIFKALKASGAIIDLFFSGTHFLSPEGETLSGQKASVLVEFFHAVLQLPLTQLLGFAEQLPTLMTGELFPKSASVDVSRLLSPALKILKSASAMATLEQLSLFRQQHLMRLESQPREAVVNGQFSSELDYIRNCMDSLCQTLFSQLAQVFEQNSLSFKNFTASLRNLLTESSANRPLIVRLQRLAQELAAPDTNIAIRLIPATEITLIRQIGKGVFGEVYRGYWQQTLVAVKKLQGTELSPPIVREFRNEAILLASICHPNIVSCYGICTDMLDSPLSLLLEFLPGGGLDRHLRNEHDVPKVELPTWSIRQRIAFDIARGVAHLHDKGIVHGDLRACNILVDDQYHAKVADFGLAKQRSGHLSVIFTNERTEGFLNWLSPELFRTRKRTFASDVYSFGFILWELMTGKVPYHEAYISNDMSLLESLVVSGKAIELHSPPLDAPNVLVNLMRQCLTEDPSARPTMHAVAEMLFQAISSLEYQAYCYVRYPDRILKVAGKRKTPNFFVESLTNEDDGGKEDSLDGNESGVDTESDSGGLYSEEETHEVEPKNIEMEGNPLRSTFESGYTTTSSFFSRPLKLREKSEAYHSSQNDEAKNAITSQQRLSGYAQSSSATISGSSTPAFRGGVFASVQQPGTPLLPQRPLPTIPTRRGGTTTTTTTISTTTTTVLGIQLGLKQ